MFKKLQELLRGKPSPEEVRLKKDLTDFIATLGQEDWNVVAHLAGYWWTFGKEKSDLAFIRAIQTFQFANGSDPELRASALRSMEMTRQWAEKWGKEAGEWGSECVRLAVAGKAVLAPGVLGSGSTATESPEQAYVRNIQKYRLNREDMQPLCTISGFAWKYANMPPRRAVEFAMQTIYLSRYGSPQEKKDADTSWQSAVRWSLDAGLEGVSWGMECVDLARRGAEETPDTHGHERVSDGETDDGEDVSEGEDGEEPEEDTDEALWEARQARKEQAKANVQAFVLTLREPAPAPGPLTRMQEILYSAIRASDAQVRKFADTPFAVLSAAMVGATFRCAHGLVVMKHQEPEYRQILAHVKTDVLMFEAAAWFQAWLLTCLRVSDVLSDDDRQILIDPFAKAQAEVSSLFTVLAKFPDSKTYGERVHQYPLGFSESLELLCRALKADAGRASPVSSSELASATGAVELPVTALEFCRKALFPIRDPVVEFMLAATS